MFEKGTVPLKKPQEAEEVDALIEKNPEFDTARIRDLMIRYAMAVSERREEKEYRRFGHRLLKTTEGCARERIRDAIEYLYDRFSE